MKYSQLFGRTAREIPNDADSVSHQLLVKAGMICQGAAGVYSYLPLGWRALRRIEQIIREEMDNVCGQELLMPALQPFELWEATGRHESFGQSLFSVTDRKQRRLVLGPTHEEVITELARRYIQSYRDMPLRPYQIQTKFRDEPRPRGGLLRVREFIMKDLYSFDVNEAALDVSYQLLAAAYHAIYRRLGLPAVMVEADSGAIGGKASHEFMLLTPTGEDVVIHCEACGYAANAEKARSACTHGDGANDTAAEAQPLREIATPGSRTIEELSEFLSLPADQTLKTVLYMADNDLVLAVIRGDLDINEVKLQRVLKCTALRLAETAETAAVGVVPGFASPVGISGVHVIADESIGKARNLVAGANREGYHLLNVNIGRDFTAHVSADIALAKAGDRCPGCGAMLKADRGIEVGHIFKLGTFLSDKLGAVFLDENGASQPCVMGCYGIGIGRLLAAIVEHYHDDKGILWPVSVAPYQVHICTINPDKEGVELCGECIYRELQSQGVDALLDDRAVSPGVKFNDADLIGIPFRVTISPRTMRNQSVEIKQRNAPESRIIPSSEAVAVLVRRINEELSAAKHGA